MDLVVLCNAIFSSGAADSLRLVPFPNTVRGREMLRKGEVAVLGNSFVDIALDKNPELLRTVPVSGRVSLRLACLQQKIVRTS